MLTEVCSRFTVMSKTSYQVSGFLIDIQHIIKSAESVIFIEK